MKKNEIVFDISNENCLYQRKYQIYRFFTIVDRVELSVDYSYETPLFKNKEEAEIEFNKIGQFITDIVSREFFS